jgi:hypothetical protein
MMVTLTAAGAPGHPGSQARHRHGQAAMERAGSGPLTHGTRHKLGDRAQEARLTLSAPREPRDAPIAIPFLPIGDHVNMHYP